MVLLLLVLLLPPPLLHLTSPSSSSSSSCPAAVVRLPSHSGRCSSSSAHMRARATLARTLYLSLAPALSLSSPHTFCILLAPRAHTPHRQAQSVCRYIFSLSLYLSLSLISLFLVGLLHLYLRIHITAAARKHTLHVY